MTCDDCPGGTDWEQRAEDLRAENERLWEYVRAHDATVQAVYDNDTPDDIARAYAEARRHLDALRAELGEPS